MATPGNFTDVAWYKYGPAPGQPGDAVFDGHLDNGLGLPGVFKNLHNLRVGDDVAVEDANGTVLHFKVSDVESYPLEDAPAGDIFSESGPPRLTLITCDGVWEQQEKTYDHRLVITALLHVN
jgi:LPXTG-site transpeptidase (sortase) family protein